MKPIDRRSLLARAAGLAVVGSGLGAVDVAGAATTVGPPLAELRTEVETVIVPGDSRYATARRSWNARFDTIRPLAVVVPRTPAEVRAIVRWARKHGVRTAIRSGGHSYAGLSSTTGVVVDMSRFSGVTVRGDGTARIGAGARLGAAYAALWKHGRTISTGSHPTVGLAGLALGGGQGFLSRAYGLTCDTVTAIDIITADARLRHCSPASNADLFWALRGGGAGSFGIVTALTLRTFPVDRVTTFNVEWPWSDAAEALDAWQRFMRTAPDAISSVLALRAPRQPGASPKIAVNGQMLDTRSAAVAALSQLTSVGSPSRTSITERPYDVAVKYFEGGGATRGRLVAKSALARKLLPTAGIQSLLEAIPSAPGDPRLGCSAVLFAYGGAIAGVPPRATAFVHRDAVFSIELVALWTAAGASLEAAGTRWVRNAYAAVRPHVSAEAVQNYADASLAGWKRAYYGQNLQRLVTVKRRYDPTNQFRHALSIPTHL